MPPRGPRDRIEDILESLEAILEYTRGMDYAQFVQDRKTNRAVSFEFVVVGEAVAHLPEDLPERYPNLPWREMNAVRNYAVHEYFRLSLEVLWQIITQELPALQEALLRIREEL